MEQTKRLCCQCGAIADGLPEHLCQMCWERECAEGWHRMVALFGEPEPENFEEPIRTSSGAIDGSAMIRAGRGDEIPYWSQCD